MVEKILVKFDFGVGEIGGEGEDRVRGREGEKLGEIVLGEGHKLAKILAGEVPLEHEKLWGVISARGLEVTETVRDGKTVFWVGKKMSFQSHFW